MITGPHAWRARRPRPGPWPNWRPRSIPPPRHRHPGSAFGAGSEDALAEAGRQPSENPFATAMPASTDEMRSRVRAYLSIHLDSDITDPFARAPDRVPLIRAQVVDAVRACGWSDDEQTIAWLMDDLVGLGPLQKYMDDPRVSD